jgi:hypothetical protein
MVYTSFRKNTNEKNISDSFCFFFQNWRLIYKMLHVSWFNNYRIRIENYFAMIFKYKKNSLWLARSNVFFLYPNHNISKLSRLISLKKWVLNAHRQSGYTYFFLIMDKRVLIITLTCELILDPRKSHDRDRLVKWRKNYFFSGNYHPSVVENGKHSITS